MSRKIAIEGSSEHLKKSVAELLVRRLVAVWVIEKVMVRMLNVDPAPLKLQPVARIEVATRFHFPALEPSGNKFVPPAPLSEEEQQNRRAMCRIARQIARVHFARQ